MNGRRGKGCGRTVMMAFAVVTAVVGTSRVWSWISVSRQLSAFDAIVAEVNRGALRPDKDGALIVPDRFAGAVHGNRVYRSTPPGDPPALFFPTEAEDGKAAGYVYCESPPPKDEFGTCWLLFHGEGVMLRSIDAPRWVREAHPHWFWAEPFYS